MRRTIAYIAKTLDQELGAMPKGNETESTVRTLTTDTENMLSKLRQERNAQNDALYEAAFSKIKPTDQNPTPTHTLQAAKEVFKKPMHHLLLELLILDKELLVLQ
jgi:hypothetical protein